MFQGSEKKAFTNLPFYEFYDFAQLDSFINYEVIFEWFSDPRHEEWPTTSIWKLKGHLRQVWIRFHCSRTFLKYERLKLEFSRGENCILPVEVRVYPLGLGFFRRKILTMMISTRIKTATATPKTMYKIMSLPPDFELLETECWSWSCLPELSDVSSAVPALPYITSCPVPEGQKTKTMKSSISKPVYS